MKKHIALLSALILAAGNSITAFAEETAEDNVLLGDINFDGIVDVTDLSSFSILLTDREELTEAQKKAADVDKDGRAALSDLARLRQFLSRIIDTFDSSKAEKITDTDKILSMLTAYTEENYPGAKVMLWADGEEIMFNMNTEYHKAYYQDIYTYMEEKNIDTSRVIVAWIEPCEPCEPSEMEIEREPFPEDFPVNAENNSINYAKRNDIMYCKYGACIIDENQINGSVLAFFTENIDSGDGRMAAADTLKNFSTDDVLIVKCGKTEGIYYIYLNENLSETEKNVILEKIIIAD